MPVGVGFLSVPVEMVDTATSYIATKLANPRVFDHGKVTGVVTQTGLKFAAPAVVLTAGTFLAGKVHVGPTTTMSARQLRS